MPLSKHWNTITHQVRSLIMIMIMDDKVRNVIQTVKCIMKVLFLDCYPLNIVLVLILKMQIDKTVAFEQSIEY